jgi:hypothetical protein
VRLVAAAIEKHTLGNVEKLALGIISELRRAGFEIIPAPPKITGDTLAR